MLLDLWSRRLDIFRLEASRLSIWVASSREVTRLSITQETWDDDDANNIDTLRGW